MERPEPWFNKPFFRAAILRALMCSMLTITGLSVWLLWPEFREYVDHQRVSAIFGEIEKFEGEALLRRTSEFDRGFTHLYTTEIEHKINRISSPIALNTLGKKCVDAIPRARKSSADSDCRFYLWAEVCVLRRLSEINSDTSVRAFVDLYCDEDSALDGEYAGCAYEYLGNCKARALPLLRAKLELTDVARRDWLSHTISWLATLDEIWPKY